jgi:hypothetical protein
MVSPSAHLSAAAQKTVDPLHDRRRLSSLHVWRRVLAVRFRLLLVYGHSYCPCSCADAETSVSRPACHMQLACKAPVLARASTPLRILPLAILSSHQGRRPARVGLAAAWVQWCSGVHCSLSQVQSHALSLHAPSNVSRWQLPEFSHFTSWLNFASARA